MEQDVRWEFRFSNFVKALEKLSQAVEYVDQKMSLKKAIEQSKKAGTVLDKIVKDGLIQRFKYTHELAWNVMKDYVAYQGNANIGGSRDSTREAFQLHLISDGQVWMDMIGSRNKTSHTYNEKTADEIFSKILNDYYPAFVAFQDTMQAKLSADQ